LILMTGQVLSPMIRSLSRMVIIISIHIERKKSEKQENHRLNIQLTKSDGKCENKTSIWIQHFQKMKKDHCVLKQNS
jgi:hypothetical protein